MVCTHKPYSLLPQAICRNTCTHTCACADEHAACCPDSASVSTPAWHLLQYPCGYMYGYLCTYSRIDAITVGVVSRFDLVPSANGVEKFLAVVLHLPFRASDDDVD